MNRGASNPICRATRSGRSPTPGSVERPLGSDGYGADAYNASVTPLVRQLWMAVKPGASALQCGEEVLADDYRIRQSLAHWLTEGALEIVEPERPPRS